MTMFPAEGARAKIIAAVVAVVCALAGACGPGRTVPEDVKFPGPSELTELDLSYKLEGTGKVPRLYATLYGKTRLNPAPVDPLASRPLGLVEGDPFDKTYWVDATTVNICHLRPDPAVPKEFELRAEDDVVRTYRVTTYCGPRRRLGR